jgi:hypothetical protein
MVTAAWATAAKDGEDEGSAWGRVTAGEREARWGHRGGVLELAGPAETIDAIERSLFAAGAATSRIDANDDAFVLHPSLLEIVTRIETRAGLLTLAATANESGTLTARVEDEELTVEAGDTMHAVAAVHQLLSRAGIFISTERAGL